MKALLTTIFAGSCLLANAQSTLIGNWQGLLTAGTSLRMVFHVTEAGGKLSATMDSPDQGVSGIPCASVYFANDSVGIEMGKAEIRYTGRMVGKDSIAGKWHQGGRDFEVNLKKTDHPAGIQHSQTPKPPFNYLSEDVLFNNADKSIQYGATITIPKAPGTYPAVLLVSGSGPQNRDEEIMGHKPFAVIADYLTNHGYIVLRVDDRGVGQTTGTRAGSTSADFAKDAEAAIDYLKTRKEVNKKKIGIMGHSEGGLIAPMVAAERKDIDFIVMQAGPGVKTTELMAAQTEALLKTGGVKDEVVKEYGALYRNITTGILKAKDSTEARNEIISAINQWKTTASKESIEFTGAATEAGINDIAKDFMAIYNDKWYNYFFHVDPQPYLQKLSCKVLAINGNKDIQVLSSQNLPAIQKALEKSKSKVYTVKEFSGLNHLFQHCKACTVEEYRDIDETFSTEALQYITDWLDKNVK